MIKFFQCDVCGAVHQENSPLDVHCCDRIGNVTEITEAEAAAYFDGDVEEFGDGMSDVEADADTLRNVGWGTDEDYGYFGDSYMDEM
jgi:hypothetical protein